MTALIIGIPRALLYHRYGILWTTFFENLGFEVLISPETTFDLMSDGLSKSVDECCLPLKLYLGHIQFLQDKCDYIFVPRNERLSANEEFCPRFWGLPDIVRSTFPDVQLLSCDYNGQRRNNHACLLQLGRSLSRNLMQTMHALRKAQTVYAKSESYRIQSQNQLLQQDGIKVLLAGQPYILRDAYMSGPLLRLIQEQDALPVFPDSCSPAECIKHSHELSRDLYWVLNREVIGSIPLLKDTVDGVILLTAFPCGTDSLVNELILRKNLGIPVTHIVLDEQQGEAGLQTRIECFIDILKENQAKNRRKKLCLVTLS